MWPYDYFNEFSSLEVFLERDSMGAKQKAFVAMWYGGEKEKAKQNKIYENLFEKAINDIKTDVIITSEISKDKISDRLKYRLELEAIKANKIKKGDININILGKIIESTLVIFDITPIGKDKNEDLIFCPNVMFELGIALAWKMPEQVIILCNEKNKIDLRKFPIDIRGNFIHEIDYDRRVSKLQKIIKGGFKDFKDKKDILLKNVKSKLDKDSLGLLARRNGLMFAEKNLDNHAIRHLLNLGVIRTEIFRGNPVNFGYCLTEIGRALLRQLSQLGRGIRIFPDMLIDMVLVRFCEEDKTRYKEKKGAFKAAHGIGWSRCLKTFQKHIPDIAKKELKKKFKKNIEIFDRYVEEYPFDFVNSHTVKKWERAVDEIRKKQKT